MQVDFFFKDKNFTVFFTSEITDMPVESMIGFLNFLIVDNNKKLSMSPYEILKAGTPILFKKIALFSSKGVERKVIFFLSQYFFMTLKLS